MTPEVIVVGAGIAGLSAARALAEAGRRTLLLEASARVGGRIWTNVGLDGVVMELGAEFVHGNPKPTLELARAAGAELIELPDRHFVRHGTSFEELHDPWSTLSEIVGLLGAEDADRSARAFIEERRVAAERAELFRQLVEGFEAAPLDEVSMRSLAADSASLSEDDSQYRVRGGYGALVEFTRERALGAGAEIRRQRRVTRIAWSTPNVLSVSGRDWEEHAQVCVIAVPLGVMQRAPGEGGIAFEPEIAPWRESLGQLAMGQACRVSWQFPRHFAQTQAPRNVFIHQPTSLFETLWSRESETSVIWTAWAGGPKASALARESAQHRTQLALGALATVLDVPEASLLEQLLSSPQHHDFSNDEYIGGAYSFCHPGGAKANEALQIPLGDRLILAGEATDHEYPGTVAGAIASGTRAAEQAQQLLALHSH